MSGLYLNLYFDTVTNKSKHLFLCNICALRLRLICIFGLLIAGINLNAQFLNLPEEPKTSKKAPAKPYKAPSVPAKSYKNRDVQVRVDISAKVILNIEAEGKTLKSEFTVTNAEVGGFYSRNIFCGDATLELRLPNQKSFRYDQFLSIDPDIARLDIALVNGNIAVTVKTNAQLTEEKQKRALQAANELIAVMSNTVSDCKNFNAASKNTFMSALSKLRENNLVNVNTQKQGEILVNALESLTKTHGQLNGKAQSIEFYRNNSNYVLVNNARADFNKTQQSLNQMVLLWGAYQYSNAFITRISSYLSTVQSELSYFPKNKEAFDQKVQETVANWERISAEEEKRRVENAQRIEQQRQARIKQDEEAAAEGKRIRLLEQNKFDEWNNKSGAFFAVSLPLGIEFGVLASDRLGYTFGFRRLSAFPETWPKYQLHNSMTFPLSKTFQGGVTVGLGAQPTDEYFFNTLYDEVTRAWGFGLAIGGRLMIVEQKFMLGLEATFGSPIAQGFFLIAGFKIGSI